MSEVVRVREDVLLARVSERTTSPWRRVGVLAHVGDGTEVRFAPVWRVLSPALTSSLAAPREPALELAIRVDGDIRVIARLALTPVVVARIQAALARADRSIEGGPQAVRSRWHLCSGA